MFPDALTPSSSGFRNTVIVNIKTTPVLPNQSVRLKSFDVDDPSSDTGGIIDTNDYFGFPGGNDNRGAPKAGQLSQTTATLDSQGKAFAVLTVPVQPGDNLRVAAVLDTSGAQAHLDSLQVAAEADEMYVSADTNAVPGFVGGISPMLIVWRKLHLEFDSMDAPPATGAEALSLQGQIISLTNNYPSAGRCQLRLLHTNVFDLVGFGDIGKIVIPSVGSYRVHKSSFRSSGSKGSTTLEPSNVLSGKCLHLLHPIA
jgi:hypothetical protein